MGDAIRRIRKPKWCDNGFLVAAELMKDRPPFIRRFIDYPRKGSTRLAIEPFIGLLKEGEVLLLRNEKMK